MKKILRFSALALICATLLAGLTGCGGYDTESMTYGGEKGSMIFFGVNYNQENSRSEGVTIEVNFAHETTSAAETPHSIYTLTNADGIDTATSVYALPLNFSTSEDYNAKNIKEDEFLPGRFSYTCDFPQEGVELTLSDSLFADESGSFRLVLATPDTDFSDTASLLSFELTYSISGDTITLGS